MLYVVCMNGKCAFLIAGLKLLSTVIESHMKQVCSANLLSVDRYSLMKWDSADGVVLIDDSQDSLQELTVTGGIEPDNIGLSINGNKCKLVLSSWEPLGQQDQLLK